MNLYFAPNEGHACHKKFLKISKKFDDASSCPKSQSRAAFLFEASLIHFWKEILSRNKMSILSNFLSDIYTVYRSEWKLGQNHKKVDIFRTLAAILEKLYTCISILISNQWKQFSGPVINIGIIYRTDCKLEFWSVDSSMIIFKIQQFVRLT